MLNALMEPQAEEKMSQFFLSTTAVVIEDDYTNAQSPSKPKQMFTLSPHVNLAMPCPTI